MFTDAKLHAMQIAYSGMGDQFQDVVELVDEFFKYRKQLEIYTDCIKALSEALQNCANRFTEYSFEILYEEDKKLMDAEINRTVDRAEIRDRLIKEMSREDYYTLVRYGYFK